jgi:hypothetical protein
MLTRLIGIPPAFFRFFISAHFLPALSVHLHPLLLSISNPQWLGSASLLWPNNLSYIFTWYLVSGRPPLPPPPRLISPISSVPHFLQSLVSRLSLLSQPVLPTRAERWSSSPPPLIECVHARSSTILCWNLLSREETTQERWRKGDEIGQRPYLSIFNDTGSPCLELTSPSI